MRRLAALLLALLGGLSAAVLLPAPTAHAAAIGRCTTTRGTIVAVSFAHWGGPVVRGCGVQPSGAPDASGYALLQDGGFSTAGDEHDGPAFICRLGNAAFDGGAQHPTPAQDPCVETPPASAYWSAWLAPPGATSWHYSDRGAMGDRPVAGGVEYWTFGATDVGGTQGGPPASLIPQLRAQDPTAAGGLTPTSPAPVAIAPTTRPTTPPAHAAATHPATAPSTSASASPASRAPVAAVPGSSSPGSSPGPSAAPRLVDAQAAPPPRHRGGSVVPVVLTAAIVAVLGGVGGVSLLRRRRAGEV